MNAAHIDHYKSHIFGNVNDHKKKKNGIEDPDLQCEHSLRISCIKLAEIRKLKHKIQISRSNIYFINLKFKLTFCLMVQNKGIIGSGAPCQEHRGINDLNSRE
ncbi:hypothetical protein CHARACLAT_020570 [Characodon lateralis]|uniref:Uncharacterized protein n=1 Tax=Characodon lateralis TaxID=208331 RepID=A0ABU7EWI6_9TELE|nr:hypothetical protein [Characodon lateralis]